MLYFSGTIRFAVDVADQGRREAVSSNWYVAVTGISRRITMQGEKIPPLSSAREGFNDFELNGGKGKYII